MENALNFSAMQQGFKKLTLELPADFHEKLRVFCFENRTTMKDVVADLLAKNFNWKKPPSVDLRKMTRAQREKFEDAARKSK